LRPGHAEALNQQIQCRQQICDWRGIGLLQRDLLSSSERFSPFGALTIDSTPAQQLAVARTWCEQRYAAIKPLPQNSDHRGGKIRLGYLSADFCNHAMAHPVAALIEHHDRQRFEIIAYSYGPDDGSPMRRRLAQACDRFTDIRSMPAIEAAKLIQADGIDILIDLAGYTTGARTEILAFRPAPVQVNFLGYPGTMGAGFIDYIIADPVCIPLGEDVYFSETVVRLADCYQPNDRRREIAETPSREACGLPARGVVFCCFNNIYKIAPEMFAVWMRLLEQVPDSVLWLLDGNTAARQNLRREAGGAADRLIFAPRQPMPDHLARHRLADLFLDTLPYNAHTTASDALWAGLPVLTCRGKTFAGRVAASLLTAVGLPELIASSLADYEALALGLAREPARLAAVRDKLAANRHTAPLFDSVRFARAIETAYRQMVTPAAR
jgi:predicted O-linked N-acetylglucosamine transferase (SPINDLY family)